MELEMWRDILGYEGLYQISSMRRVKNVKSNKILTCGTTSGFRYKQAALCRDGKRKVFSVHRLVAEAFIPNPNNFPCVNHIDFNRENNNYTNLEWCTVEYNNSHRSNCVSCKTIEKYTK